MAPLVLRIGCGQVFLLADLLQPIDDLAVERLLDRDMAPTGGCGSAVPMLFARRANDDVAGADTRLGPPQHCTQSQPAVTINLWPSGWVCHAVRAPGSNVTNPAETRDGSVAGNSASIRTLPVKCSAGPLAEGCEPLCLISIALDLSVVVFLRR